VIRRADSKIDPGPIIKAHLGTLVDARTGNRRSADYVEQYALPVVAVGVAVLLDVRITVEGGAAILAFTGIFAAFMFQLTIQLLDRAATWADDHPPPGPATSRHASLLEELSANAAYAALVSLSATTVSLGLAFSSRLPADGMLGVLLAAGAVGLLTHLGTTVLLITRRVFLLTQARLLDARTGSHQDGA
jgi:hypothetical protein